MVAFPSHDPEKILIMSVLDRFPNYISSILTLSAANTFTTTTLSMPIPRVTTGARNATIMELLYVDVAEDNTDYAANGDNNSFALSVGSAPGSIPSIRTTTTICSRKRELIFNTSGMQLYSHTYRIDLQDKHGFGFLVAADTLNVSGDSTGMAGSTIFHFRIYYRFVTVPIEEYVGIVSSLMS